MSTIGEVIEELRQHAGITRQQLADACGLTRSAVLKIENGERFPREDTALLIAKALNTTTHVLYDSVVISKTEYDALVLIKDACRGYLHQEGV